MASARGRRPSASVLITSIVLPFIAVTTSPGLVAEPEGMFSVVGTRAVTLTGAFSLASAHIAEMTAAPPDISPFISSIPAAGLMEMPPEAAAPPAALEGVELGLVGLHQGNGLDPLLVLLRLLEPVEAV